MPPRDERLTELRAATDAAIVAGQHATARTLIEKVWRSGPGPSAASFVHSRLRRLPVSSSRSATVAILRSFTVEPVVPLFTAAAALHGLDASVHIGGFGTYTQELLDPRSPLYTAWDPRVVIVAVQTRAIAPELWHGYARITATDVAACTARVIAEYRTMVAAFRSRSSAQLVVHGLELPPHLALGIADGAADAGQAQAIHSINEALRRMAAEAPGMFVIDFDSLVATVGRRNWYDEQKWESMRLPMRADCLLDVAMAWLRVVQPLTGLVSKALVVDLDNTLWGGVVGEDGPHGIQLGQQTVGAGFRALQHDILDLKARGILLAICSKNNEADAVDVFDNNDAMILKLSDFSAVRINWDNKSDNLRSIADELNIGLDAVAFLDDNPAECALIRSELPEVLVLEMDRPPQLGDNPVFGNPFFERVTLSDEDRQRSRFYAQQAERRNSEFGAASLDDYLRSLEMSVVVSPMAADHVARVAQLTQKTNQFNLTTKRYSELDVQSLLEALDRRVYVVHASDRFGDHGLIGVMIVDTSRSRWTIDTMLLSCRVIGRGVETAMISELTFRAAAAHATAIVGSFVPTPKNAPAANFYAQHGFTKASTSQTESVWAYELSRGAIARPEWFDNQGDAA